MKESVAHLKNIPQFAKLIEAHGMPDLRRGRNPFRALVRSIIHQQVSGRAAETIYARFVALFPHKRFPTPEDVCAISLESLRSAGLSGQKASYIKDLAEKFADGTINPRTLHKMSSAELEEHLVQVKGIGMWTVHMFLIFTLGRPDVLPTGDLGIRKGFQAVFGLRSLPSHDQMEKLAKDWRAHASVASWYLWRAADSISPNNRPLKTKRKKK